MSLSTQRQALELRLEPSASAPPSMLQLHSHTCHRIEALATLGQRHSRYLPVRRAWYALAGGDMKACHAPGPRALA